MAMATFKSTHLRYLMRFMTDLNIALCALIIRAIKMDISTEMVMMMRISSISAGNSLVMILTSAILRVWQRHLPKEQSMLSTIEAGFTVRLTRNNSDIHANYIEILISLLLILAFAKVLLGMDLQTVPPDFHLSHLDEQARILQIYISVRARFCFFFLVYYTIFQMI